MTNGDSFPKGDMAKEKEADVDDIKVHVMGDDSNREMKALMRNQREASKEGMGAKDDLEYSIGEQI